MWTAEGAGAGHRTNLSSMLAEDKFTHFFPFLTLNKPKKKNHPSVPAGVLFVCFWQNIFDDAMLNAYLTSTMCLTMLNLGRKIRILCLLLKHPYENCIFMFSGLFVWVFFGEIFPVDFLLVWCCYGTGGGQMSVGRSLCTLSELADNFMDFHVNSWVQCLSRLSMFFPCFLIKKKYGV